MGASLFLKEKILSIFLNVTLNQDDTSVSNLFREATSSKAQFPILM